MTVERHEITADYDWERRRRFDPVVNASETAIVCREGGYGTLAELYAWKKGLRDTLSSTVKAAVLDRGSWGEAATAQAVADVFPHMQVYRAKIRLVDTDRGIAGTPDGFVLIPDREGDAVIEFKSVSLSGFRKNW